MIPDSDRCPHCRGKKIHTDKKGLEVFVEKGMKDNQKLILRGKGNQVPGMEAGDVLVILQEEPHGTFKRVGDDLYVKKEISLTESLCGFSFALTHLDGRVLHIVQPAGLCVKTGKFTIPWVYYWVTFNFKYSQYPLEYYLKFIFLIWSIPSFYYLWKWIFSSFTFT